MKWEGKEDKEKKGESSHQHPIPKPLVSKYCEGIIGQSNGHPPLHASSPNLPINFDSPQVHDKPLTQRIALSCTHCHTTYVQAVSPLLCAEPPIDP